MLEKQVKSLPTSAGVYQYFDKNNKLLYIGKAKNLSNRVKNYFRFTPNFHPNPNNSTRIVKMVREAKSLHYIVVDSEHDALILENSLIKQLQPKYNILLRDDKTYPYIYIDLNEPFARFEITRKVIQSKRVKYFGPYASGARELLDSLYQLYPLVQSKSCLNGKKACLYYQLKQCLAPCEGKISSYDYYIFLEKAMNDLYNKQKIIMKLESKMQEYSENLRFEEAMKLRDQIKVIKQTQNDSTIDVAKNLNVDIIGIEQNEHYSIMVRMFMRDGKIISSSHIFYKINQYYDRDELYYRAILDFYNNDTILTSQSIIVAHDFSELENLSKLLSQSLGKKILIEYPKIGDKKRLIDLSITNAKTLLFQKIQQDNSKDIVLDELKILLDLEKTPQKIEIFDNSHMQGRATVGAMVCYEQHKFIKSGYRHYHLNYKDDYHQMKEMLTKRIESFEKNSPPDLWILDGGLTLVKLAKELLNSFGANIDVIAIAKEKVNSRANRAKSKSSDTICYNNKELKLKVDDKHLQLIQKLRDEAHRFAISFHKKTKLKQDQESELLKLKGIGSGKIKKLLAYFGTFLEVKKANLDELEKVLSKKDAQTIFEQTQVSSLGSEVK